MPRFKVFCVSVFFFDFRSYKKIKKKLVDDGLHPGDSSIKSVKIISEIKINLYPMNTFTFKEKEVLALVSSGLTTKEIASRLNISHHTVETHRKNLLRKCEAKNSVELVQKALMQQLITV
jgi:DNA-binding CsgD family transcriptional regulator